MWSAGDCARYKDIVLDDTVMMGNWMNAVKQGETSAMNMTGGKKEFGLEFSSTQAMALVISSASQETLYKERVVCI